MKISAAGNTQYTTGQYTKAYENQSHFAQVLAQVSKPQGGTNNDKRTINTHRAVGKHNYYI